MDKPFAWDPEKNSWLKETRGFGFEAIVEAVENGRLLDDLEHATDRYAHQRILVVDLDSYAVAVPYVEEDEQIFLKTAFRDRKLNRRYETKTMTDAKRKKFEDEDQHELEALHGALDAGTLRSKLDQGRRDQLVSSAKVTSTPVKERITTRLPARDLARLKAKAMELGIPYQTLLASVVHRYVEGTLVDRES